MSIQEIVQQLKNRGVSATPAKVEKFLEGYGVSVADVTEGTLDAIAQEFQSSALATAPKAGKAAKAKNQRATRGDRATNLANEFKGAIASSVNNTKVELEAMQGLIDANTAQYEEATAQRLVDRIREVPVNVIRRVGQLAAEEEANPEMFRTALGNVLSEVGFDMFDDAEADATEAGALVVGR